MEKYLEDADVTFFSSDRLYTQEALDEMLDYLGRWIRKSKEIQETIIEIGDNE